MKKNILFLSALITVGFLTACNDEGEKISPEASEEVSLLVAASVASNTYGVNALLQESVALYQTAQGSANGRSAVCDYTDSGSEQISSTDGSMVTYNYSYSYDVSVNCSSIQVPVSLSVDFTYSGSFDGPKLTWSHDGNGDFEISLDANQNLVYNGTYDRSGEYNVKERENINGSSNVDITLTSLTIDPETQTIISGSGLYEIQVTRSDRSYTLKGSITFNGDGTASLIINGSTVTFNLISGNLIQD
ncbi:hypothetical protein [Fulvivirga sedimenti]|uniref:Lipoprotein n=1 Tax=Fulvivirga sedimenti TaxID=2879465 RepID=A0A9X1HQU1_9BACT|nr:hypothetical protein [Fulvivirga sedimenti]MCA6075278.1 hypothetical protein [Fulvivirga sedimenti]MCA6076455.1 hypothetical protein [Fulvivirga sedimenti]MCA6077583.1 hypothetical protein [Fulvivirga sedimenti]